MGKKATAVKKATQEAAEERVRLALEKIKTDTETTRTPEHVEEKKK